MQRKTRMLILSALFAALTSVGAFMRIPMGFLSLTLQFFFTALAGLLLGPKWGALSQAVYVGLGLAGLPVFTMGGGPAYLFQPSFGFLLGLIPAAWVIGRLSGGRKEIRRIVFACIVGDLVLYAAGLPYMYLICNVYLGKGIPLATVIRTGMLIYLPGDALKIAAAAALTRPLIRSLGRTRP